jgi:hypothetical protein
VCGVVTAHRRVSEYDSLKGFGLDIGFIDHFSTQLVI